MTKKQEQRENRARLVAALRDPSAFQITGRWAGVQPDGTVCYCFSGLGLKLIGYTFTDLPKMVGGWGHGVPTCRNPKGVPVYTTIPSGFVTAYGQSKDFWLDMVHKNDNGWTFDRIADAIEAVDNPT